MPTAYQYRHAGLHRGVEVGARANIEKYGGDPKRVMFHVQSGGGRKTTMILTTTPAQGLYHRAVVQSGAQLRVDTIESATSPGPGSC